MSDSVYRWFVRDCYRVVYEHGADGQALSGDIDVLREVLMRNAPSFCAFCRLVDPDACSKQCAYRRFAMD